MDGIIENRTAVTVEPYLKPMAGRAVERHPHDRGGPPEGGCRCARSARFQCHFHAIGDGGVRLALDAVQAARDANGDADHRHHIAHIELIHPDDIGRFATIGAIANMQPFWAMDEVQMRHLRFPVLGADRARWQYPFRSLLTAGARMAGGSDWPVDRQPAARDRGGRHPYRHRRTRRPRALPGEERLTLDEALAAFTLGSAYVNRLEGETGSIEVGKRADLAILDRRHPRP